LLFFTQTEGGDYLDTNLAEIYAGVYGSGGSI
jgi:hypothetical protein